MAYSSAIRAAKDARKKKADRALALALKRQTAKNPPVKARLTKAAKNDLKRAAVAKARRKISTAEIRKAAGEPVDVLKTVVGGRRSFVQPSGIPEVDKAFMPPAKIGPKEKALRAARAKPKGKGMKVISETGVVVVEQDFLPAAGDTMTVELHSLADALANPAILALIPPAQGRLMEPFKLLPPASYFGEPANALEAIRRAIMTTPAAHTPAGFGRTPEAREKNVVRVASEVVQGIAAKAICDHVRPQLVQMLDIYTALEGPRPTETAGQGDEATPHEAWDGGLDEALEIFFSDKEVATLAGAGWLGVHTIDSQLQADGKVDEMARSLGVAIITNYCATQIPDTSDAKVLSRAGITIDDLKPILDQIGKPAGKTGDNNVAPTQQFTDADYEAAYGVVKTMVDHAKGVLDLDMVDLMGELEQAGGDDDVLAASSISRLGFKAEPQFVQAFRICASASPKDSPRDWINDVVVKGICPHPLNIPAQLDAKIPKLNKDGTERKTPGRRQAAAPTGPANNSAPQPATMQPPTVDIAKVIDAVRALKEVHTENEIAKALDISRATLNNYITAKSAWAPTEAQMTKMRSMINEKLTVLERAIVGIQ